MTKKKSIEERIEAIKREEREDASVYYEQGGTEGYSAEEVIPTEPIDKEQEMIGLLKTIAMVALGVAGLALVSIFYFISDLETRVSKMDASISETGKAIGSSVAKLDENLKALDEKMDSILTKLEDISASSPSGQNGETAEESEEGDEETSDEEQDGEAAEESEEGEEEGSAEEQDEEAEEQDGEAEEESEEDDEEGSAEEQDEEAAEESEDGDEEAEEHASVKKVKSDVIPALAPADDSSSASHAGDAGEHQKVDEIEEELPTVEELKQPK